MQTTCISSPGMEWVIILCRNTQWRPVGGTSSVGSWRVWLDGESLPILPQTVSAHKSRNHTVHFTAPAVSSTILSVTHLVAIQKYFFFLATNSNLQERCKNSTKSVFPWAFWEEVPNWHCYHLQMIETGLSSLPFHFLHLLMIGIKLRPLYVLSIYSTTSRQAQSRITKFISMHYSWVTLYWGDMNKHCSPQIGR